MRSCVAAERRIEGRRESIERIFGEETWTAPMETSKRDARTHGLYKIEDSWRRDCGGVPGTRLSRVKAPGIASCGPIRRLPKAASAATSGRAVSRRPAWALFAGTGDAGGEASYPEGREGRDDRDDDKRDQEGKQHDRGNPA